MKGRNAWHTIKNIFSNRTVVCVIFYILLAFLVYYPFLTPSGNILAGGENLSTLNHEYTNRTQQWDDKINGGSPSTEQAYILIFTILFGFINLISNIIHPSIIYALLIFIGMSVSIHLLLKKIFPDLLEYALIPATVLYSYNIFRATQMTDDLQNLLAIILPLLTLSYWQLLEKRNLKYLASTILLLNILTCTGQLLVFTSIVLILGGLGFSYVIVNRNKLRDHFLKLTQLHVILFITIAVSYLYWLLPNYIELTTVYKLSKGGNTAFRAMNAGHLYDHFRFIGYWAWDKMRYSDYYFPYHKSYYHPILIITTYFITLLSLLGMLISRKKIFKNTLFTFAFLLFWASLFLINGSKAPTGSVYSFLYYKISAFRIYRDPFVKFTPFLILSSSILLTAFIEYIFNRLPKVKYQLLIIISLTITIMFNSFPIWLHLAPRGQYWNGGYAGYQMVIPDYWKKLEQFLAQDNLDEHPIAIYPKTAYGNSYFWNTGAGLVGNIADYLLPYSILRPWSADLMDQRNNHFLVSNFYNPYLSTQLNILSIYSAKYVLQENDLDWRFIQGASPPNQSRMYLESLGLKKVNAFGQLDREMILTKHHDPINPDNNLALEREIQNQDALVLWELPAKYLTPFIYLTTNVITSDGQQEDLPYIIGDSFYQPGTAVIEYSQSDSNLDSVHMISTESFNQTDFSAFKKLADLPLPSADPKSISYDYLINEGNRNLVKLSPEEKIDQLTEGVESRTMDILSLERDKETQQIKIDSQLTEKILNLYLFDFSQLNILFDENLANIETKEFIIESQRISRLFKLYKSLAPTIPLSAETHQKIIVEFQKFFTLRDNYFTNKCAHFCYELTTAKPGEYYISNDSSRKLRSITNSPSRMEVDLGEKKVPFNKQDKFYTFAIDPNNQITTLSIKINHPQATPLPAIVINDSGAQVLEIDREQIIVKCEGDKCVSRAEIVLNRIDGPSLNLSLAFQPNHFNTKNDNDGLSISEITRYPTPPERIQLIENKTVKFEPITPVGFTKSSSTRYELNLPQTNSASVLVFAQTFNNNWHLFDVETRHLTTNGFANGWIIPPQNDMNTKIEYYGQRRFWTLFGLSITAMIISSAIFIKEKSANLSKK